MKGGLTQQYLGKVLLHYANQQTIASLKRAENYLKNIPVTDYSDGVIWSGDAKWDAVALIDACRRACEYNHDVVFAGTLAKYAAERRAR